MRNAISMVLLTILSLSAFVYIGYFEYHGEEGYKTVFFIKSAPSLKIKFENPALMSYEQRRSYYADGQGLDKLAEYCHYRYGAQGSQTEILAQCGKLEDITLPND